MNESCLDLPRQNPKTLALKPWRIPNSLAGLDENDPQSMARFMKNMGEETGEDLGDDLSEAMESDEAGSIESDGTG